MAFGAPHLMATASFDGEVGVVKELNRLCSFKYSDITTYLIPFQIIVWSMISCNILSRLKARLPTFAGAVSPPTCKSLNWIDLCSCI